MSEPPLPYRSVESQGDHGESSRASPIAVRGRFVTALGIVVLGAVLVSQRPREDPGLDAVPDALRGASRELLFGGDPLPPSTPLAPLLAIDQPDRLAVIEPNEGATRYDRGDAVVVRFNRPMVAASLIGRSLESSPITFTPPVQGVSRWTSRSTLRFTPEESTWDRTVEATLRLSPGLSSLSGEALGADVERVVVFDGSPRIVGPVETQRVSVGAPLRVTIEGRSEVGDLRTQMFAYEMGGALRPLGVRARAAGLDPQGRHLVDLLLDRSLEAGTRVGVAFAPGLRADRSEGEELPGTLSFEFAPPPQIEGVDCSETATSVDSCASGPRPARIVDIGRVLRLLSSEPLREDAARQVQITPVAPGLEVRVEGRLLVIGAEWEPDQVYELRIASLVSAEGVALRGVAPLAIRSAGLPPAATMAEGALVWERAGDALLPFAAVNVEQGALRVRPLDDAALVGALLGRERAEAGRGARVSTLRRLAPTARRNRWGTGRIAWSTEAAGEAALIELDPVGRGESFARRAIAQRTDLAVSALALGEGVLAWVTSLQSAAPLAGARVRVFDEAGVGVAQGVSDASGSVWIALSATALAAPMAVLASHGGDRAGMVLDRRRAEGAESFGVAAEASTRDERAPVAAVVLDRGAVRPGERVRAKVIARQSRLGALQALARQRVRLSLRGPSGEVSSLDTRLSAAGTADGEFVLSPGAAPGSYQVVVVRGGEAPMGTAGFEVAEFRPPTARVDLALARTDLLDGDEMLATVRARYLFGAPVSNASVRWSLRRLGESDSPERWRAFTFGPVDGMTHPGTVDSGEGVVDREGVLRLSVRVRHEAPVRESLSLEASVRDASGQETSARQRVETFPAAYEVALRRLDPWIEHGRPIDVDAVVLAHDGSPAPGVRCDVKIYREGWHGYYQWAAGQSATAAGAWRARREQQRELVRSFSFDSGADVVRTPWAPTLSGTYVIEATVVDAGGHRSVASQRVYAAGPTERPDRDPPGAPFALTPVRADWMVGERAVVGFECPWPEAEALIAVSQSGVIHRERRRVRAGAVSLALPVTAAMTPNAFVTVTLLRPRSAPARATGELDLGSPDVRWGATELRVRPRVDAPAVEVRAPREVVPGSEVPIDVEVRDSSGRGVSTELLLYAVDEGVLRLTRYETPDPASALLVRRAPRFSLEDLRRSVVSRISLPALPGASGDGGDAMDAPADEGMRDLREDFDPTPMWLPRLRSDANGRAQGLLRLPSRAGQYRVMALAIGEGLSSARASTIVTARRDVALRALLPRTLTQGDVFEVGALLNNTTERAVDATLTVRVNGRDRSTRRVRLEASEERRVGESIEATAGTLDVELELTQGRDRAVERRSIVVAPRSFARRETILGAHDRAVDLTLRRRVGTLEPEAVLTVSTRPFLALDAAAESLDEDPLGGVATVASRVIAWSALARADAGRSAQWAASEARMRGETALRSLQRDDGGFGAWDSSSIPVTYLTSLALQAFGSARRAGWAVDDAAVASATATLRAWVREQGASRYHADELAYALRALHDVGADQPSEVTQLFDSREVLRAFGCAQLAMAMMPDDPRRPTLLAAASNLMGSASAVGPARPSFYDTQARTIAAVLEAAVRADRFLLAREAAQQLLAVRAVGASAGWGDARSTAMSVDALVLFASRFGEGRALRATVRLDGREVRPVRSSEGTARYVFQGAALADGDHRVRVEAAGGTVFTALDGRWREPIGEAESVARGRVIALHRALETESGRALEAGASVRLGELVRVRLWTYAERRSSPYLVITNRHGGGFDAVDQGFDTTPQASIEAMLGMGMDDAASDPRVFHAFRSLSDVTSRTHLGGGTRFFLDHGMSGLREYTYAMRATTPGRFMIQPAEIRALYDDATVARSTASHLVVTR